MKYLPTPEFTNDLASLSADVQQELVRLIHRIEAAKDISELGERLRGVGDDIYVCRLGRYRVFVSVANDGHDDYLLLVRVAQFDMPITSVIDSARDPRRNPSINPQFDFSINPNYNSSINPRFNSSINPQFNSAINPRFNSSINPNYNPSINPRFNSSINPQFNSAINPHYNRSINPRYGDSMDALLFYNLEMDLERYAIVASSEVRVMFDYMDAFSGIAVKTSTGGYVIFDINNEWTGHLVFCREGIYVAFDTQNTWTGIVVGKTS